MNFVKGRFILNLFLMVGMLMADPTLADKPNSDKADRKLYGMINSSVNRAGPRYYLKSTRGLVNPSLARRHLQDDAIVIDGTVSGGVDPMEQTLQQEFEKTEDVLDAELEGVTTVHHEADTSVHVDTHEHEVNDHRVREILSAADVEIDAQLTYEGSEGPVTIDVKIKNFRIVGEPLNVSLETAHFNAIVVVRDHEGKAYSSKFKIDNGELKEPDIAVIHTEEVHILPANEAVEETHGEHLATVDVHTEAEDIVSHEEPIIGHETTDVTFVHGHDANLVAEEIQITNDHLTAEEPGHHLENEIVVGEAIVHHEGGDEIKEIIIDHGEVKESSDVVIPEESVPVPDLITSPEIHATMVETTESGDIAFEGDIHEGIIVHEESVPEEILEGGHDLTVITHEEGVPQIQHIHEEDGVITIVEGEPVHVEESHIPVAEVAGTGIITADAIIETPEGPIVEPVVFNNAVLTEEPADAHLSEGAKDIDVVVHDPSGPHMEHVHLEDGHVVEAIADETSIAGTAQEGEQHVDVLVHDSEGYHVEDILVKDDQIMEEPSDMDLEHGEHEIETLVHDHTGPHIEHWKIEEGMVISHHAEGYVETHSHSGSATLTSSELKHSTTHLENGTVHVEMLLDYGKQASVEDVLLHNGAIIEHSPGIDLQHGIHIAEAITKGVMGPEIEPVVVHDGIVEPTATEPHHEPEHPVDITHGDVHAEMIEGQGPAAKVEDVVIHDGKIVEETGPIDLEHGTHVVETVVTEEGEPHIETDVVVDGEVKPTGPETHHALIVVKEGENTEVSEVEIQDHKIVEQSEGTDLTTGVFVGTEVDLNADGSVGETKEIVGNNGEISEVTTHIPEVAESHPAEQGDALLVFDTPQGTEVDQIHYDGSTITSETGPVDLSGHETGIEIMLDPTTHQVQTAEQVTIDDHHITVVDETHENVEGAEVHHSTEAQGEVVVHEEIPHHEVAEHVEVVPVEYVEESPVVTEHVIEEGIPIEHLVSVEHESIPVSRRAYIRPNINNRLNVYSKAYNPIQKRGLYNSNRTYTNSYIRRPVSNRIAISRPSVQPNIKRITYNSNIRRANQYQPRRQQVVHRIAPVYRPGVYRALNNTGVKRVQVTPKRMAARPMTVANNNRLATTTYIRQPIVRYNTRPAYVPTRPQIKGQFRTPSFNNSRQQNSRLPVHFLKI